MTREERIEQAIIDCGLNQPAAEALRKTAALFPDMLVWWVSDTDDVRVWLENHDVEIEIWDLT